MEKISFYFNDNILIRKEHFGTLIFLRNGKRYCIDNVYFNVLKTIYSDHFVDFEKVNFSKNKLNSFLRELTEKKIITHTYSGHVKIVENKYISNDCMSFPRTVYWECTQRCNFNCIHCYSSSNNKLKDGELKLSEVKTLIRELSAMGTEFLSIGGGEPLLYPHIADVVEYAAKKSVAVEISTNASLVTDKIINNLKIAGLKFIQISIDGATNNTYSKIRKGGDLSLIIKNIDKLSKHFVVSTCMVVNKINIDELEDVIDLSIKLGAKFFRIIPFMEVGRAKNLGKLQLEKSEFKKMYRTIINKRKKVDGKISIQLNENLVIPNKKNISWMPDEHYGCSAGRTTCGIDSHGNVYPCSYMVSKELVCGNIKNKSLLEIWTNSEVMKKLRTIDSLEGKCSKCKHLSLCRGGCRAAAYLKFKKVNASDPLCSI